VPWLTIHFGWRASFIAVGVLSALWIVPWLATYRSPRGAELRYIQRDQDEAAVKVSWSALIRYRETWAFLMGKFMTDPIWWFFMFWLPKFLATEHKVALTELGWPLVAIYNIASIGSVLGGWLPAQFLKRGWSLNRARKTAMLICALGVTPVIFTVRVESVWSVAALVGLATAAHQGWSANLFTLASDMFPKHAVASVVGIGGFGGAIGGMIIATFTGVVLQYTGSYVPMFALAGGAYLAAIATIHLLVPEVGRKSSDTGILASVNRDSASTIGDITVPD
jgi:ACS family hexuronate transporter-like MFS transporter